MGNEDNSKIIFLILNNFNIQCDPSLELSQGDGLKETVLMMDHNICFYGEIRLNFPVTPSYLEHRKILFSIFLQCFQRSL